jgi:hypothetical protein
MSKLARNRGADYEREVSKAIFEILGVRVKRNLSQYQEAGLGDLILEPFVIECKRRRAIALYDWIDQADEASSPWQIPVVVCRADNEKSLAVFHLEHALKLMGNELTPPEPEQGVSVKETD